MESLKKRNVVYNKGNPLIRAFRSLNIFFTKRLSRNTIDTLVRIKTGNNISAPIKDLLYKGRDGVFRTIKTKLEIDDEIPNEYLTPDEDGNPTLELIYHNGTGEYNLIKLDGDSMTFSHRDIRMNDIYESIGRKLVDLFKLDKEKKFFVAMLASGMIALGLMIMFALQGLAPVIEAGLQAKMGSVGEAISQVTGGFAP